MARLGAGGSNDTFSLIAVQGETGGTEVSSTSGNGSLSIQSSIS
ncbi:MAG: hypothetical protein RIM23_23990 [Coleofasciculus sp. G3-WIS-01]